jgi:hypothetical protein
MKEELVGERVTLHAPADAVGALVVEAVTGLLAGAEMAAGDPEELAASLQAALAELPGTTMVKACLELRVDGVDVNLGERDDAPAATIEYRV